MGVSKTQREQIIAEHERTKLLVFEEEVIGAATKALHEGEVDKAIGIVRKAGPKYAWLMGWD